MNKWSFQTCNVAKTKGLKHISKKAYLLCINGIITCSDSICICTCTSNNESENVIGKWKRQRSGGTNCALKKLASIYSKTHNSFSHSKSTLFWHYIWTCYSWEGVPFTCAHLPCGLSITCVFNVCVK